MGVAISFLVKVRLSRRGEWETAVGSAALDQDALKLTPWVDIDPDGKLFEGLLPSFVTAFDRTIWRLHLSLIHI